jgi:hypothetical protein
MKVKKMTLFERSEFVIFSEGTTGRMEVDSYRAVTKGNALG